MEFIQIFFCRRCGECEGCMRDDCGQCAACADKPKFGGRGSKKKACAVRACRMKGSLGGSASNQQKQTGQAQAQPQQQHMMVKLPNGQILQIVGQLTTQPTKWLLNNELYYFLCIFKVRILRTLYQHAMKFKRNLSKIILEKLTFSKRFFLSGLGGKWP